jgi:hypothetical protein
MTSTREARRLALARVALGLIFLARTTPLLSYTPTLLGWPSAEWSVADFGLALPNVVVAILCVLRTAAAVLFTCGVRARACGIVAAGAGYLVLAQDRFAFVSSLHILFLSTFVFALTVGRPVASSIRFVTVYVASIYFWAGLAKVQPEWLSGDALAVQARAGAFGGPLGWLVERTAARTVASVSVPVLELGIAALLVADRRRIAIVLALVFHGVVELAVLPDTLGYTMAVVLLSIWPPRRVPIAAP